MLRNITEGYNGGILINIKEVNMKKLKIICDWDKDYDTLITQEKLKNGDLDRNSWWYLDGQLEEECGYDIHVDLGRCLINGNKSGNGKKSNYDHESYNETANNMFKVNCSSGDVELDFNN